jgi:hypothetical protein
MMLLAAINRIESALQTFGRDALAMLQRHVSSRHNFHIPLYLGDHTKHFD